MKKYLITEEQLWAICLGDPTDALMAQEIKPIEPMSEGAKRALACNWFAERWAQDQAMGLLADYDQAIERHITGGAP